MKKYIPLLLTVVVLLSGCESLLDIKPVGKVIPTTLKEYRALLSRAYYTVPDETGKACFRSDEMYVTDSSWDLDKYGKIQNWDDFSSRGNTVSFDWKSFYSVIFTANYTIEKQSGITEGSKSDIQQLVGECYLLRAYMHFSLANLYALPYTVEGAPSSKAVPLKMNSNIDELLGRNTLQEVYTSVLKDIEKAESLINKESWEQEFSYRFTVNSVYALRSRVYLYMGDYEKSLEASKALLARKAELEDFNAEEFKLPNHYQSVENITALALAMPNSCNQAACASDTLLKSYKEGDLRANAYFEEVDDDGDRFSKKGGRDDFRCSFRVGEIYLNAAEAAARLGQLDAAKEYISSLIDKRYEPATAEVCKSELETLDQENLITEILLERERELAFEGHRWFDLRRTTRPRIEKVIKEETYVLEENDKRYTILIPFDAIASNPELNK